MSQFLENLHEEADLIILDGPPLFIVDSQILASKVGGILLVVRQGATLTAAANSVLNQLKLLKANILGVVLNYIPQGNTYYGDYRYAHADKPDEKVETIDSTQGVRDIHPSEQTHIP
jgi:Mrp family chromosome partitioning ATPase